MPETPSNIVRGPWDEPAEKPRRRLKLPVWRSLKSKLGQVRVGKATVGKAKLGQARRGQARRGKGEPMVNNWGRLALLLGLLFVLPPVASWLVHHVLQLMSGAG